MNRESRCTCTIKIREDGWEVGLGDVDIKIEICVLHKAAPALLEMLEAVIDYLPNSNIAIHLFWQTWLPPAKTIIKQAKGGNK